MEGAEWMRVLVVIKFKTHHYLLSRGMLYNPLKIDIKDILFHRKFAPSLWWSRNPIIYVLNFRSFNVRLAWISTAPKVNHFFNTPSLNTSTPFSEVWFKTHRGLLIMQPEPDYLNIQKTLPHKGTSLQTIINVIWVQSIIIHHVIIHHVKSALKLKVNPFFRGS